MDKDTVTNYLKTRYQGTIITEEELNILIEIVTDTYLNAAFPFSTDKSSEKVNYSWVLKACVSLIERGEIDIKQYTENEVSTSVGTSLMAEIVPKADVPRKRE